VQQYKRDGKKAGLVSFRRHDHFKDIDKEIALVVAPILSSTNVSLGVLLSLVKELKAMPEPNHKVLVVPDLSALAHNSFSEDKKTPAEKIIKAAYDLLICCLRAAVPDLMKAVSVCYQSETMLVNPSDYWISVINVGRHFQLQTVLDANGNSSQAGAVFAALLHVADVITMKAARVICSSREQCLLHELAVSYLNECGQAELNAPSIIQIPAVSTRLREGDLNNVQEKDDLHITNTSAEMKKKIKQSFCEEGNTEFCPALELAKSVAIELHDSITIGEIKYDHPESLISAFSSKIIHPSELKPAVTRSVNEIFTLFEKELKQEPAKGAKAKLQAYAKKISMKSCK